MRITMLGVALGVLAISAGCGDDEGSGTSGTGAAGTGGSGAGGSGGAGATGGSGGEGGGTAGGDIYVDAESGQDSNPGTIDEPVKTIGHALTLWTGEHDIVLNAGTFSAASGEDWNYQFPPELVLRTNTDGVVLRGTPADTAFILGGDGTIEHVTFEGFGTALQAIGGSQILTGVSFDGNERAIELLGDADMRVGEYPTFAGGAVAWIDGTASLSVDTGTMNDLPQNPEFAAIRVVAEGSVRLSNLEVAQPAVAWVYASDSSSVEVVESVVTDSTAPPVLYFEGAMAATLTGLEIHGTTGGSAAVAVDKDATGTLNIEGGNYSYGVNALYVAGGTTSVSGAEFWDNSDTALRFEGGVATVEDCQVFGSNHGLRVGGDSADVVVRGTTLSSNPHAVLVLGALPDLGTVADPGNNTFYSSGSDPTVLVANGLTGTFPAVGNTWEPNKDFADDQGHYSVPQFVGPYAGENFDIPAGVTILLD